MISAPALVLTGLLQAGNAGNAAVPDSGVQALVVVALPANSNRAIIEALNRLRGEATSVGFEVRLVDAATESVSLVELDGLSAGLRPAAVVAFARPEDSRQEPHSLDVWFLNRASGKTSVAHLTAGEVGDVEDRADVIIAVRAVDFIRARMFDTLAGRPVAPAAAEPRQPMARQQSYFAAAGLGVLGSGSGFSPSLAAQITLGYRPTAWLRIGVSAFGLGTAPERETSVGQVSLDQRFVGANLNLLGREWRRLQPILELGAGEYWVLARGAATPPNVGRTITLSSPGATTSLGLALGVLPYLALEFRAGALWLQNQARIGVADTYLGSVGRPIWLGSACLVASF